MCSSDLKRQQASKACGTAYSKLLTSILPMRQLLGGLPADDALVQFVGWWLSPERTAAERAVATPVLNAESEFDAAFSTVVSQRAGAMLVCASPFFNSRRQQLIVLASSHALPAIFEWRDFAVAGGLMSYGTSLKNAYRQAGVYAGRILKGEKASDLPVVQSTKFEFVINLSTAKALHIEVPPTLSARADEIIE